MLEIRNVGLRNRLVVELPSPDVGDDADDLAPGLPVFPPDEDPLADRVFRSEEAAGHRLVDQRDGSGPVAVRLPERAAAANRDLRRAKEVRRDAPVVGDRFLVGGPVGAAFDPEISVHARSAHGQAVRRCYGGDAGQGREALERVPVEGAAGLRAAVAVGGQRELEGGGAVQPESRVDVLKRRHRTQHQARADQQDQRERDLGDDEQVAQLSAVRRAPAAAVARAGERHGAGPRRRNRGTETEEDARDERKRRA